MNIKTINFNQIKLRDYSGSKSEIIDGSYTLKELQDYLIAQWVNYVECHHCSRSETCKYAEPHPLWQWKKKEIICGVKSEIIRNYIYFIFNILSNSNSLQQELLLSSAYFISEFAIEAEVQLGRLQNQKSLNSFGEYAKSLFGNLIHLREILNKAAQDLNQVPQVYKPKPILLVEGQSEKAFIEGLKNTNLYCFKDLRVEVYGGHGNAKPKNIKMRMEKYIEDGYVCYMQGDRDGNSNKKIFNELIRQGIVDQNNTFIFEHDFETAVPPAMLLPALKSFSLLEEVELTEFEHKIDNSQACSKIIQREYDVDITSIKVDLAYELAWLINDNGLLLYPQDENIFLQETELGRFISFVMEMSRNDIGIFK